ncbi:hypothetical protein ASG89_32195 [Paenibacillus sp. Soil766]|uniref:DUF1648 domain-containing protein n=1 Tax=Paenibacillus sp. Soil766 TaxID=1736404 RepID=UPI00070F3584|nr:DUF1648 domain-containing protein [Paenibacillus sp. Soil766]KRE94521.1 hypothetical protein ASG89_32195 [Paenibacillus sp. Soil766]
MEQRPVIQLARSKAETILDVISLLAIITMIAYVAYQWRELPERMPMHFNGKGEIDGWGNKMSLIALPLIGVIIYIGLTFLSKVPHVYNYPSPITPQNARGQYQNARLLINSLKTVIVILFGFIEWSIIQSAKEGNADLNWWVLGFILLLLFGTIIFFIVRSIQLK